ncbi:MAG: hypothetical protein AAGG51_25700 [Cyanobacteria bacterium P01_G01_bin.54]
MKCTQKQAERIEQLLAATGIYYVSPIECNNGEIAMHTGQCNTIRTFDLAMEVILQLSDLDLSQDPDNLLVTVQEILEQAG